ncbi:hypothetical protein [Alsobacter sp. R-9]
MRQRFSTVLFVAAASFIMLTGSASAQLLAPGPGNVTNNAFDDNLGCFWSSSQGGACLTETDTVSNSSTSSSMSLRTNETTFAQVTQLVVGVTYTLTYYVKLAGAANAGQLAVAIFDGVKDMSFFQPLLNANPPTPYAGALNEALANRPSTTGNTANGNWTEYKTSFQASSNTATIFFNGSSCTGQSTTCFRIDEIRVPAPLPGAGVVSLLALCAAAGASWLRKRSAA